LRKRSSRRRARSSFSGFFWYRHRAQGECGRASRTAPTKNRTGRNTPNKTVHILPFSKVIAATANSTTSDMARLARASPLSGA